MKKVYTFLLCFIAFTVSNTFTFSQTNIDTLAIQDFEIVPASPTWNFTGPVIYNSGFSGAGAAPANSPIGIGGSRAWETTTNSGGLVLDFDNITIPVGYDSIRVHFNLAAMNLTGATGGPDNLDYVLVAYSLDNGGGYTNRLRIRGASTDNSFWAYDATGVAQVNYLPAVETMFQPTTTGLQTTFGYSNCEIVFPGSVTQIKLRITGRSSSSSDTWLVDNLLITGENNCTTSFASLTPMVCNSYTAPSGAVYTNSGYYYDTIPNFTGCDSILGINLVVLNGTTSTINPVSCGNYSSPSGLILNASGNYTDTISNMAGCDSIITINLTINNPSNSSIGPVSCGNYTAPSGTIFTMSGFYFDTIPNFQGCDSIIGINLVVHQVNSNVSQAGPVLTAASATGTYQWYDCNNGIISGETNPVFTATANGDYALIITDNGCTDTSACFTVSGLDIIENLAASLTIYPNPSSNYFIFDLGIPQDEAVLELLDEMGRVVMIRKFESIQSDQVLLVGIQSGIYVVRISYKNGLTSYTKLIKK